MRKAFNAYKEKIWEIVIVSLIVLIGIVISTMAVVAVFVVNGFYTLNIEKNLLSILGTVAIVLVLAGLLIIWLYSVLYSVLESAVKRRKRNLKEYFKRGGEKLLSLIGVSIVSSIIILIPPAVIAGIGYIINLYIPALIIGGVLAIYFSIRLLFSVPLIYLADRKALEAIKESFVVTKKYLGDSTKIYIVTILIGILSALVSMVPIIGSLIQFLFFVPYASLIVFHGCQELYKSKKKVVRRKVTRKKK